MAIFHFSKNKLPGPSLFDFINESPQLPYLFQLDMAKRYGDICKIPGLLGFYQLNSPDTAEHVLKTHHKNYIKTDLAYKGVRAVLGNGLLANANLDTWLTERRLLQPLFHSHQLMQYVTQINQVLDNKINEWKMLAQQQTIIDWFEEMLKLTLALLSEILFSGEFNNDNADIRHFSDLGNRYINKLLYLYPWLPTIHNIRYHHYQKKVDALINTRIQQRLSVIDSSKPDLLTLLLTAKESETGRALSHQEIVDEIKTFLITGHETVATALAWTLYCLGKNPDIKKNLQDSLAVLNGNQPSYENLTAIPYPLMVFEEAMRLYPPVWMITRKSIAEDQIAGFRIPANSTIVVSTYALHHRPDYWSQPEIFNPKRFSENEKNSRPRYAYIPFGMGPRICIGSSLAVLQAQFILIRFFQEFDFELASDKPIHPQGLITLRPHGGIKVILKNRG